MSSREFYLQRDLFTGELVDNRSAKQKQQAQDKGNIQQAEPLSQQGLAQFSVEIQQDPGSEEEKELDLQRSIVKHTFPLPGLGEGSDRKVRLVEQWETKPEERGGVKHTPTHQDHEAFKQQYPEAMILYRMGDFFETFGEDAKKIARELDLVLLSRIGESQQRVPMAGMPCHVADRHIACLLEKGYTIAICEQVRDGANLNDGGP